MRISNKFETKGKVLLLATMLFLFCYGSCKKDRDENVERYCWNLVDPLGNESGQVCNKTEAELIACAAGGSCVGGGVGVTLTSCNYYKAGGSLYCWYGDGGVFIKDATENKIAYLKRCFGLGNVTKVDCNYCGRWYIREKRTYKPAATMQYSPVQVQQLCGDTARTLFHGREIIRKDDADSLIVIQFSSTGLFF